MDSLAKEVDESLSSSTATYSTNEDDKDSSLDAEVMKAAKELTEDGQLASDVIEGSDGYYVVRMDSVFDKDSTQTKKDSIVKERKQKAYDKLLKKWAKKTKISVDKKVWKTVTLTDEDVYSFKQADTSSKTTDSTDSAEATENTVQKQKKALRQQKIQRNPLTAHRQMKIQMQVKMLIQKQQKQLNNKKIRYHFL